MIGGTGTSTVRASRAPSGPYTARSSEGRRWTRRRVTAWTQRR
ncbi:hypothetical protein SNL152K_855 [Streptomyces sp. NL15-2K]|nr:hypothetical protein SNL152K_855 [Streptomyces sp. NL15-2K]